MTANAAFLCVLLLVTGNAHGYGLTGKHVLPGLRSPSESFGNRYHPTMLKDDDVLCFSARRRRMVLSSSNAMNGNGNDFKVYERRSLNLGSAGRLNLFGLYYGSVSILLGLVWMMANFSTWVMYNFFWRVLRFRWFDPARRFAILLAHVWGVCLMRFTRCYPVIEVADGAPVPVKVRGQGRGEERRGEERRRNVGINRSRIVQKADSFSRRLRNFVQKTLKLFSDFLLIRQPSQPSFWL